MKTINKRDLPEQGKLILVYGNTGVGKTTSIFQSEPDPLLCVATEPRNPRPSIESAGRDPDMDVAPYTNWFDLMDFLQDPKNTERYATIAIDSITYLMNVSLCGEIEDEAFEAKTSEEKRRKPIVSQAKMSMEGYGGLSSQMFRLMKTIGRLSEAGKIVIVTALLQENPKWDRELAAAPALKGREFPTSMPGFFDLIGLVESRVDGNGKLIYPPMVSFESSDGSFLAKFTGTGDKRTRPLNFIKLLKIKRGGLTMKISTNQEKMDIGYQLPEAGKYLFQVAEGIDLFTNENSGKTSLKVPTKILEAIDGDESSVDITVTHFIPIETNYGEKQLCSLLTITDLAQAFEKRFADGTSFMAAKFVDSIKLKLPGKLFVGEIEVRDNNKGQKNANFKSWERHEKKKSQPKFVEGKTNEVADEEW